MRRRPLHRPGLALTNGRPHGIPEAVCAGFLDVAQNGAPTVDWPGFSAAAFRQIDESEKPEVDFSKSPDWAPSAGAEAGEVLSFKGTTTRPSRGTPLPLNRQALKADGFTGFRTVADLEINRIPQKTGLFAVLRPEGFRPQYLAKSTAGVFKKKDPTLSSEALAAEWVDDADVLYVGKAGPGSKGNRGLRRQIQEFVDFGTGKPPGHWDGRLVWQLAGAGSLIIAWKELPAEQLTAAEAGYHARFREEYGRLPFANLVQSRVKGP